ncbi:MAG: 4'-phosphopantetheinyl transferase superfamily protein [Prolixibacteraceae bacterium]
MPLYKTIPIAGGILGIWQLTETSDELMPRSAPGEISSPQFQKYSYEKRKAEYLATRILIRLLAGTEYRITYLDTGKPVLHHARFSYIAISHSREYVAVILHETAEVGIDIESIDRNYSAIEKRYLSPEELITVNGDNLLQCLYWCAKEAVFKLVPEDGIEFREQIHVSPFNPEKENQFKVEFLIQGKGKSYLAHFQTFDNHGMVWLCDENDQF